MAKQPQHLIADMPYQLHPHSQLGLRQLPTGRIRKANTYGKLVGIAAAASHFWDCGVLVVSIVATVGCTVGPGCVADVYGLYYCAVPRYNKVVGYLIVSVHDGVDGALEACACYMAHYEVWGLALAAWGLVWTLALGYLHILLLSAISSFSSILWYAK